jgi:beta-glucosidase
MPSYNEIDGLPSHANRWLLHDVLRKEWGFKGVTVSRLHRGQGTDRPPQAGRQSGRGSGAARDERRGRHRDCPTARLPDLLAELVREGKHLSSRRSTRPCARVLKPSSSRPACSRTPMPTPPADAKTATPDAIALAREAARKRGGAAEERQGPAAARRRASRQAAAARHPRQGHPDRRLQRHAAPCCVDLRGPAEAEAKARASSWTTPRACGSPRPASGLKDEVVLADPEVNAKPDRRGRRGGQESRHHRHGPGRQRTDQPRGLGRQPPGRPRQPGPDRPAERPGQAPSSPGTSRRWCCC